MSSGSLVSRDPNGRFHKLASMVPWKGAGRFVMSCSKYRFASVALIARYFRTGTSVSVSRQCCASRRRP